MRIVTAFCLAACTLLAQEMNRQFGAQQQTKTLGDLYPQPSFSSRSVASIPQYTSYQLLSNKCDKGWYQVYIPSIAKNGYMFYSRLGLPYGATPTPRADSFPSQKDGQGQTPLSKDANVTNEKIRFRQANGALAIEAVAVVPQNGTDCEGADSQATSEANVVEQELLGVYQLVDRSHLQMILNEQNLAMSGLVLEEGKLAEAGCLAGAQGTVIVSKGCLAGNDLITIKLLDCSTSVMSWVATGPAANIYEVMDEVRSQLRK